MQEAPDSRRTGMVRFAFHDKKGRKIDRAGRYACSYGWMDGCMDGSWIHGCMHAWMHGCMDTWRHGGMCEWAHVWMDACMHACMHGWMDVRTYVGIGRQVCRCLCRYVDTRVCRHLDM